MDNHYITIHTFGVILFSIVILSLAIYSYIMTVVYWRTVKVYMSKKYEMCSPLLFFEKPHAKNVWSLKDAYKREKLLEEFERLRVKPPEDVTFKELVPPDERGENPLHKMLS